MKHAALLMSIVLLIPIVLGTGQAPEVSIDIEFPYAISLVGINHDGRVDFRGTLVFFSPSSEFNCAINMVFIDGRGDLRASLDMHHETGIPRIETVNAKLSDESFFRLHINSLGLIDSFPHEIDIYPSTSTGTWRIANYGESPPAGTCVIWNRTLTEEIHPHAKTADDLIQYWRTPREQDEYLPDED